MDNYIVPMILVSPKNVNVQYNNNMKITYMCGKIKDEINCDELLTKGIYKNKDFVNLINESNYSFIPIHGYYNDEVSKYFDIYGGIFSKIIEDVEYIIKIYFYKIKNIELITKNFIEKFRLIFQYDYFMKNNILNMDWHSYRLSLFSKDIETKFYNLYYVKPDYCRTKLFNHQIHNISSMINIYRKPREIEITDDLIGQFDNGLIYNFVSNNFIEKKDIPKYYLKGGMILDEPGTGKTLQFILFLLEMKLNSLVLVPNNDIKKVWIDEFNKHIMFDITKCKINILTFDELEIHLNCKQNILDNTDIIGVDEIHMLYTHRKELFKKIVYSNIISRWGITGTPFVSDTSLFNIIQYLVGKYFQNERIANIPLLQNKLLPLFLKNLKINMAEYSWPELSINNIFVNLDIVQKEFYNAELNTTNNILNLRMLVSQIHLMINNKDIKTPTELKLYGISRYKNIYETELAKLNDIINKLKNIKDNKQLFSFESEYIKRIEYYNELVENQSLIVEKTKIAYKYFMNIIENISNIMKNEEIEENCPICLNSYTSPIIYFKKCGHYFCEECITYLTDNISKETIKCPMCRTEITNSDMIVVKDISAINDSPKIHEVLKIIEKSISENSNIKFIIFTQFDLLDKIKDNLNSYNITAMTYPEYIINGNTQVLLLSSKQNAEGINLSMFDKLIIFEPFEDHLYCKEIEKQIIARIHRIGRTKPVDVYRLITKDTIEEDIYHKIDTL